MRFFIVFMVLKLFATNIEYLNTLRISAGEIPLKKSVLLTKSAYNHSKYMYFNHIFSHYERQEDRFFTGVRPSDRAIYVGYKSRSVIENISYGQDSFKESIDGLFSAIYHRFVFLDDSIDLIGMQKVGKFFTYDMGNSYLNNLCTKNTKFSYGRYYIDVCANKNLKIKYSLYHDKENIIKKQNPKIILWPPRNSNNIPPVFYEEYPDPLPNYSVSGYPISVIFNSYYFKRIKLKSFKLFKDNKEIKNVKLMSIENDPNHKFKQNQFALFPLERLDYNTIYRVVLKYVYKNQLYSIIWNFKTKNLHVINVNKTSYKIKENKSYIFYFKPSNRNDKFKSYRVEFYENQHVDIKFIDFNTIKIKVKGKGKVKIYFSNAKKLNLLVY